MSFRALGSGDRDGLSQLFSALSAESRRLRYLGPKLRLSPKELTYLTEIDHVSHDAIAAIDLRDGAIVGVGRYAYHRDRAGAAELAVTVADEFQAMGIGGALARASVRRARANGFSVLTATTLQENRAARALLRRLGFRVSTSYGGELDYELRLPSRAHPQFASASAESADAISARKLTPSFR